MPKILIVDDEPTIVPLVADYLEAGFNVVTAPTGEEALMRARTDAPDLVVLDPTGTRRSACADVQRSGNLVVKRY